MTTEIGGITRMGESDITPHFSPAVYCNPELPVPSSVYRLSLLYASAGATPPMASPALSAVEGLMCFDTTGISCLRDEIRYELRVIESAEIMWRLHSGQVVIYV